MSELDYVLRVNDASQLTDADWAEVIRWQQAYHEGGIEKLSQVMDDLSLANPTRHATMIAAFWPETVRLTISKQLIEAGLSEEDVSLLISRLEGRLRDEQHSQASKHTH